MNWKIKTRIAQLKAMHELMIMVNNESIYMTWIYLMPDEPSEDDFQYIAEDDDAFKECYELFLKLISKPDYL